MTTTPRTEFELVASGSSGCEKAGTVQEGVVVKGTRRQEGEMKNRGKRHSALYTTQRGHRETAVSRLRGSSGAK